ncbi:MAG: fasciclin domain-containing protein [Acidimicrobiales bacterium]
MTVPSRTSRSMASVLVAAALLVGACGDDEQSTDATGDESTTTAAETTTEPTDSSEDTSADEDAADAAEDGDDNIAGLTEEGSIAAVAAEAGATAIPGYAAVAPGFAAAIEGDGPITAFVPTDEAFLIFAANYPDLTGQLQQDPNFLDELLQYHLVEGEFTAADLTEVTELTTVQGETISVEIVDGEIVLNEGQASITQEDLEADNGVIQIISSGLIPPSMASEAD